MEFLIELEVLAVILMKLHKGDSIYFDIRNIGKARAYNIKIKENKNITKSPILISQSRFSKLYSLDPIKRVQYVFIKGLKKKNPKTILKDIAKRKIDL